LLDPPTFPTWTDQLESPQTFPSSPSDCIGCIDPSNIEACAVSWAKESNKYTCSDVYGPNFSETDDLAGAYLDEAAPIVETQVAKGISRCEIAGLIGLAGLRVAVYLNLMVVGHAGFGDAQPGFKVQERT
jgi:hypothetical protein